MKDRIWRWLASLLPKQLVYFAAIRMWAHATSGKWSDEDAPSVTFNQGVSRWEDTQ